MEPGDKNSAMRKLFFCSIVLLVYLNLADVKPLVAQEPLDGSNRIFRDEFLNNLVGDWKLTRKIRGSQPRIASKPSGRSTTNSY